jgi:catechol 2,3-dioxygenase
VSVPAFGTAPAGYRLPADIRLGPVRLQIADLERSIGWYTTVLGFAVLSRDGGRAVLGGADAVPLLELVQLAGARPAPRRGRLGLYHFAILLPDRAALGRLLAHLGQLGAYAGSADHLVSEALYLTDPDGLGVEVYADRPRSSWSVAGGELVMATDPLDVAGVIDAGLGMAWTGLPAGTTVGHVHLHVGDLDAAARFYHQGLGLDAVVRSYPGALFLSAGGYHHHLGLNTWAGASAAPAAPDDARLLEWTIELPSAESANAAAESLVGAGHQVERLEGGYRALDPWGTPLRLRARGDTGGSNR